MTVEVDLLVLRQECSLNIGTQYMRKFTHEAHVIHVILIYITRQDHLRMRFSIHSNNWVGVSHTTPVNIAKQH